MVFQDPREALNPFLSIGQSVGEPLRRLGGDERRQRVAASLSRVGLDPARAGERPAAFSGGQLQRVVIARALAPAPKVLVCDEPTSSLDVSVQAQIVNLLLQLQAELGFACVLVAHDLTVARVLADDVLVLRRGVVVEQTSASSFFAEPQADYSRSLLGAVALAVAGQARTLAVRGFFAGDAKSGGGQDHRQAEHEQPASLVRAESVAQPTHDDRSDGALDIAKRQQYAGRDADPLRRGQRGRRSQAHAECERRAEPGGDGAQQNGLIGPDQEQNQAERDHHS